MKSGESASRFSISANTCSARVSALGGVALDLPMPPQVLGRIEKNLDVVELPHGGSVKAQQSFHDYKLARHQVLRPHQRSCAVVVHRLQHRLAIVRALQVQFQNVEIIAVRMQGSDLQARALGPVVLVIVVGADVSDALRAQQAESTRG